MKSLKHTKNDTPYSIVFVTLQLENAKNTL